MSDHISPENWASWEHHDRFVEIDTPDGRSVSYEYDPDTKQKSRTFTDSSSTPTTKLRYSYDALGRLRTVTTAALNGVHLTNALVTGYFKGMLGNIS